ncbi:hypothetical protein LHP98_06050 [Rhodobacter sp. Har01]|nr:hypothetical protein [Rhodobacter sp. Har01]MCB6177690.1 hypothetical protein [Rhodobacter sp. Har01]
MNMPQKGDVMQGYSVVAMLAAFLALAGGAVDHPGAGQWDRALILKLMP